MIILLSSVLRGFQLKQAAYQDNGHKAFYMTLNFKDDKRNSENLTKDI